MPENKNHQQTHPVALGLRSEGSPLQIRSGDDQLYYAVSRALL